MYVHNRILYDNNGNACVPGDRVKIVCNNGSVMVDVITMITNEQKKGFEDNEIYLRNGYVALYNIKEVHKVVTDMREKIEEYIGDLDKEIERCELILKHTDDLIAESRLETLIEVKNDLQSRLDELV